MLVFYTILIGCLYIHYLVGKMFYSYSKSLSVLDSKTDFFLSIGIMDSCFRGLRVNIMQYCLIGFALIVNVLFGTVDRIEYQDIGILYMVIVSGLTILTTLVYVISDAIGTPALRRWVWLLQVSNTVAVLYLLLAAYIA